MPKQKFDKSKAVTFKLVHRSQQDPLIVDENAPQKVLVPVAKGQLHKHIQKKGILKDLPPELFPSEREEDVGMLAKAAPISGLEIHIDPDIAAAMDSDEFDYSDPENQLEDNFIEMAGDVIVGDMIEIIEDSDGSEYELEGQYDNEDAMSKYTDYSCSTEQQDILNKKFEKFLIDYDDDWEEEEIPVANPGGLDLTNYWMQQALEENEKEKKNKYVHVPRSNETQEKEEPAKEGYGDDASDSEEEEESSDEDTVLVPVEEKKKYDCVSILSTYSNKLNHPKIIDYVPRYGKIKINKKTGIPTDSNGGGLTSKNLKKLDKLNQEDDMETESINDKSEVFALSQRSKHETAEEKRERKKKFKEYKRERRVEKKMNQLLNKEASKQIVFNERHIKLSK